MKQMILTMGMILLLTTTASALSWAYAFVVYNGNVYEVTDEVVSVSEVDEQIGEVKSKPDDQTGDYYGDASNFYEIGTKYYEIKGTSKKEAIAIEDGNHQFKKAEFRHEAPIKSRIPYRSIMYGVFVIIIISFVYQWRRKINASKS
ncbi:hypothetical protein EBB45_13075 [Lysinibacillus composti]|uniref:DUF3592 domain-containing protein n=2 Tax=Lysinibacillus composti TaxID=720633 RepID=A0A3N9UCV9_9BACI|nr:hypothetical protein EBB45_13075 [Lysinibacillus composti]